MKIGLKIAASFVFVFVSGCWFSPTHLRTRVVVQRNLVECDYTYQVSKSHVEEDIKQANKIFWWAGVDFRVESVEFRRPPITSSNCWSDAAQYPDFISIYYIETEDLEPYRGLSMYIFSHGVIVTPRSDSTTLAHELGHVFGLVHTFEEDGCEDTPHQKHEICDFKGDVNCGNVMSYCQHGRWYMTLDQVKIVKRCIERWQQDCRTTLGKSALDAFKEDWQINDNW